MATTTAFRPALLTRSAFRPSVFRQTFQRRIQQRRPQSTSAAADASSQSSQSGFSKFFNSEVGPKTVHFWAPIMKWALVLTGMSDFARPAETLSLSQNMALMATGAIWTRWCFIIRPRNVFLASVNALLFVVGATQVGRIFAYNKQKNNNTAAEEVKELAESAKASVKSVVDDPSKVIKK